MDIGLSSASLYPQQTTETAIVNIAAMGCPLIEVFLQTAREYSYSYVRKLARLCRLLGIKVYSIHAPSAQYEPSLFYTYSRQRRDAMDTLQRVMEAGALLEAQCHVFHGPLRVALPNRYRFVQILRDIAELEASYGLKLALENVSWGAGYSPAVFRWLNQHNISNLYYTFDSKQAARSGYAAGEYLDSMGSRLVNVHISDGQGGLPQGQDFSPLILQLRTMAYTGPVILEVYGTKIQGVAQLTQAWKCLKAQFN